MGSLCTGVAGLDLGVHAAYRGDTRIAWYAEVNPDASTVLAARLPGVPNLGDLTAVDWTQIPRVDVLTAGFPCQPVSAAGKQKGEADERWLWDDVRAAYRVLRPQELVFENVRNLVSIRQGALFGKICADLQEDGYAVRWTVAGACAVGAPHHRHRVFIVARYAWQLEAPPARQIKIAECGARKGKSRALLPTPTASRYGNNQGGASPGGPVRHSLDQAHLLLPVPDQALLPTPTKSDGPGGPGCPGREGADNLRTAIAVLADGLLLPTPTARDHKTGYDHDRGGVRALLLNDVAQQLLLPTPTCGDATNTRNATSRDPDAPRKGDVGWTLSDVTHNAGGELSGPTIAAPVHADVLLPTPRHSDADKGSPNQHGSRPGDLMLPSAVIGARYGRYAAAVALWERLCAMAAPEPTMLNGKGQWRLDPRLPEWMMGYPAGWITDLVGRSAALRCAGNGVVPQVVATVYPLITAGWPYLQGGEVCPDPIPGECSAGRRPLSTGPAAARRAGAAGERSAGPAAEQLQLQLAV